MFLYYFIPPVRLLKKYLPYSQYQCMSTLYNSFDVTLSLEVNFLRQNILIES